MHIDTWRKIYTKVARKVFDRKKTGHFEPSLIYAPDDVRPNTFLVELMTKAIGIAWSEEISNVDNTLPDSVYYNIYPGEHYRLLKALTKVLNPKQIIEVGTYTGMGSRALMEGQVTGSLCTFDVIPWDSLNSHLHQQDFETGKVVQKISDLSNEAQFIQNLDLLNDADIIFIDAPKDSLFEYQFLTLLQKLKPKENKLLVLDDIRFINMTDLWVSIQSPKLDASSFGHWSGTGLVDISQPLKLSL